MSQSLFAVTLATVATVLSWAIAEGQMPVAPTAGHSPAADALGRPSTPNGKRPDDERLEMGGQIDPAVPTIVRQFTPPPGMGTGRPGMETN